MPLNIRNKWSGCSLQIAPIDLCLVWITKKTGSYQSISATYDQSQGLSVRELSDNLIPLYWHRLTTPETFIQTCMSHWLVSSGTVFLKAGHNEKVSKSKIWLDRFLRNARINLTHTNLIFFRKLFNREITMSFLWKGVASPVYPTCFYVAVQTCWCYAIMFTLHTHAHKLRVQTFLFSFSKSCEGFCALQPISWHLTKKIMLYFKFNSASVCNFWNVLKHQ